MSYIEFEDVSKVYGTGSVKTHALSQASFSIDKGEFCVIVGPSGAGKTTLLNIMGGIDNCSGGKITVDGKVVSKMSENRLVSYRRYAVGFVFQFYNLVQNLTALENVELAAEICRNPLSAAKVLDQVELSHRKNHFPSQLSGGEQQRVAIARAIAKNPKLLLCDEPTGALDDKTGRQILSLLQRTSREMGMTVVLITHNMAITQIAQKIISLRDGIIQDITINQLPKYVDAADL